MMLLDLIPEGKQNAVPVAQIAKETGRTRRDCFKEIAKLRETGVRICADTRGIYIGTPEDVREYYGRVLKRVRRELSALKLLRLDGLQMDGQLDIGGSYAEE